MTKSDIGKKAAQKSTIKNIALSWISVVFVAYVALARFQKLVIYPIEAKLLPLYSQYASLIYMPHAVRVLATAIYGPKTFWVLLPTILLTTYLFYPSADGFLWLTTLAVAVIGAACAPITCIILKMLNCMVNAEFDALKSTFHWRHVFAAGIIASAINSIGLTVLFFDLSDISAATLAMLRFFIGDIIGLFVGLVILTRVFRFLRKIRVGEV